MLMRGDFSRIRYEKGKQYTAVLEQQGRVSLDADTNEQAAITEYLDRTANVDIVGIYGGPVANAGFEISVQNGEILIGSGRYYVDGLLCENTMAGLSYDTQQFLLFSGADPTGAELLEELGLSGDLRVIELYLEVWQRLVTALDDSCLREPALGQADTTARLQTVSRVIAELRTVRPLKRQLRGPADASAGDDFWCDAMADEAAKAYVPSTGKLSAQTGVGSGDCGCQPVAAAGYRGLENQLYRVEIHRPGDETAATFKWSRENGSVVAAIMNISGTTIWVDSLGPDANLGFQANQWIEISDDANLFGVQPNTPGTLYQIASVDYVHCSMTTAMPVQGVDTSRNARARRWDQSGVAAGATGVPLSVGTSIALENGIEIRFSSGTYQSGDYWTIPARAATGDIEWPPCGGDGALSQAPYSTRVHRVPLAYIVRNFLTGSPVVHDCRSLFAPLTELTPPATPQALHVTAISWRNDDVTTLDQLIANGLSVTLDQAPNGPIGGENVVVTFEVAVPVDTIGRARQEAISLNRIYNGTPDTLLRGAIIVDSTIDVNATTIAWQMPYIESSYAQRETVALLQELLTLGAAGGWFARARIRLLGRLIFAQGATGLVYLDGQAFGQPAYRADGTTARIDLQLPSGDGATASDFEGWFYLAPVVEISLTLAYSALTVIVDSANTVIGVVDSTAAGPVAAVDPEVTVTTSYPVLADTIVALALTGDSGVGSVASIPANVTIDAGQTSATFPITVSANPGAGVTLTFQVNASVNSAIGPQIAQPESFTVTGVQPPPPTIL